MLTKNTSLSDILVSFSIDCVGILKLRNSDVEQRLGRASRSKKKSTKARMIFRVVLPKSNGQYVTLLVASSQILCSKYNTDVILCTVDSV